MVTSAQALKKYGNPELQSHMVMWDVPGFLEVGVIPKKLYCNKDFEGIVMVNRNQGHIIQCNN